MGSEDPHHRLMIYGEPGVGKTVFAGTSPKALILTNDDAETISAAAMGSNADVWVCESYSEIDEAWEYLRHEGHKSYDWVWVDNLTLLQDQSMDAIMLELVARNPSRNRWVPDQHEYLVNQNRLSTTVRNFKKLPMNVGFTAHVMKSEDRDGKILYLPMLQGGKGELSQKICGLCNMVGYLAQRTKEGKSKRILYIEKKGRYLAKGRYPGMQPELEDPSMPLLLDAMAATVAKPTASKRRASSTTRTTTRKRTAK